MVATRDIVQSPTIFCEIPRMNEASHALVRFQAGTGGRVELSTCPTCRLTRFDAQVFPVLLISRLQVPLPLTARNCWCGHFLDVVGHHGAPCVRARVFSKRGLALESATARICREAGGRVTTNVLVHEDSKSLFGGAQLAVDAGKGAIGGLGNRGVGTVI